jgi:addiction module RelB/DinJ family antitoxin
MGMCVSDAVRLLLTRIARHNALPFNRFTSNGDTVEAMQKARHGKLPGCNSIDALMRDRHAKDWAHRNRQTRRTSAKRWLIS